MSDQQPVVMSVPKEAIEALVRASVAQALQIDSVRMIESIVDRAMREKSSDYNQRDKTLFQVELETAIRKMALEGIAEWLEGHRPAIRAAIDKRLSNANTRDRMIDSMLAAMLGGVQSTWGFQIVFAKDAR